MKTIKIRDEIWRMIVQNGKFGETADDVLFRLLNHDNGTSTVTVLAVDGKYAQDEPISETAHQYGWKERRATVRMTQSVKEGELVLRFDTGKNRVWTLPPKDDHKAIRLIRQQAIDFVHENGGTIGQQRAAIKALTSNGYHVTPKSSFD